MRGIRNRSAGYHMSPAATNATNQNAISGPPDANAAAASLNQHQAQFELWIENQIQGTPRSNIKDDEIVFEHRKQALKQAQRGIANQLAATLTRAEHGLSLSLSFTNTHKYTHTNTHTHTHAYAHVHTHAHTSTSTSTSAISGSE